VLSLLSFAYLLLSFSSYQLLRQIHNILGQYK